MLKNLALLFSITFILFDVFNGTIIPYHKKCYFLALSLLDTGLNFVFGKPALEGSFCFGLLNLLISKKSETKILYAIIICNIKYFIFGESHGLPVHRYHQSDPMVSFVWYAFLWRY